MWYVGEQGGYALADILFGKANPSGKLPISFPKSVGQIPVYYNYKPSARGRLYKQPGSLEKPGRDYVFSDTKALWEFGYGLTYTTFEYAKLCVTPEKAGVDDVFEVSVQVKNLGDRIGKEAVLLYVRDCVSTVTTPVKALKGFKKIELKPGEEKTVTFTLGFDDLSVINIHMNREVEPGMFKVTVSDLEKEFYVI
jgi:beta-glucosidase